MEIVIIGSGNIAFHLAKAFTEKQMKISQIFGRNETTLKEISHKTNIPYSTVRLHNADLYLLCVSDTAIPSVSRQIVNPNCLVAHTSGSLPIDILEGNYRKACFYPMQTFSKNKSLNYSKIPIFIESENNKDVIFLKELAEKISKNVMLINYEQRKYLHLTAVFSCNFVNHLFAIAEEISIRQNIPFEYFHPLIEETIEKIYSMAPKLAQTGPAIRNDIRVLQLHENLINDDLQKEIYKAMNKSIQKMYGLA